MLPAVLLASMTVAASLAAQGDRLNGFQKTGDYVLELDGAESEEAAFYRSPSAQAVLIIAKELPAPVLLMPRFRTVEKVSLLKLDEKTDGSIDLLPNPTYGSEPEFSVDGSDVVFTVEGRDVRLKPKPALVGFQTPSGIYSHSPEYEQRKGFYSFDESIVSKLREQAKSVRVQVFFGSWCPACGQMVPRILKVAEAIRGSKIEFAYYGLDREFGGDEEAQRLGIKSVPTGVVWVDGIEVGRLSGNDWRSPEAALRDLLGS